MKKITIHLSKDLIGKYGIKRFPIRKGDTVRVIKGDAEKEEKLNTVGKEGKVIKVIKDEGKIVVENLNIAKSDGKMKPKKFEPSSLIIVKVNLEDRIRKAKLVSLASLRNKTVEEEPEVPETKKEELPKEGEAGSKEEENVKEEDKKEGGEKDE